MPGNQVPQGGGCPGKDKDGTDPSSPESHLEAGDKARNTGTFVAWSWLLAMSRSLAPRPVTGPFYGAGQGPSLVRPPSQSPREASKSAWSGARSPLVTVTGHSEGCVWVPGTEPGAVGTGRWGPGKPVPQATVSK